MHPDNLAKGQILMLDGLNKCEVIDFLGSAVSVKLLKSGKISGYTCERLEPARHQVGDEVTLIKELFKPSDFDDCEWLEEFRDVVGIVIETGRTSCEVKLPNGHEWTYENFTLRPAWNQKFEMPKTIPSIADLIKG